VSRPPAKFRTGGVPLRRRVAIAFLAVGVLGIVALLFGVLTFKSLLDARSRLIDRLDPAVTAGRDLRSALLNQESGLRGFVLAADEPFLEPYQRGLADEVEASERLERAIGREPRLERALADTLERAATWRRESAEPIIATVLAGGVNAATPAVLQEAENLFSLFREASARLETALDDERALARDRLDTATRRLGWVVAGGVLFAAMAGLALWRALAHWVLGPLDSLGGADPPRHRRRVRPAHRPRRAARDHAPRR